MGVLDVAKRFIKTSYLAERAALDICERFPLSFRYRVFCGAAYFHWISFLKQSEYWDKDTFSDYQFEQTKDLLADATDNVPYYRRLFSDIGFRPRKMQSLDDLKSLPYLSKEAVRDQPREFVNERIAPASLVEKFTSGSTGIPMTVYENRESFAAFHAFRANLMDRVGYTLNAREVMLWAFIQVGKRKNLPFIRYGNKLVFSIRYLTGAGLDSCYNMVRKFNPEYISGYPSSLSVLSSFIKSNSLPSPEKLRAVISYSETLYEWQRELMEEAFDARVFSMYSMMECAALGGECEYSSDIHIYPQYCLTEIRDAAGDYKEIIATGFANYTMPLIRYKTCDLVTESKESCPKCGRSHQTFGAIEGRVQDFLIGKQGQIIPRLMPWIKTLPHVLQFQFFQEEPGKACLKIIRGGAYTEEDTRFIRSRLDEMLGLMQTHITIEIVFVDHIQSNASGKVRMVDQQLDMKHFL